MILLKFVYVNLKIVEKAIFEGLSQVTTRSGRKVGTHHGKTVEVCPEDSAFEVVIAFSAPVLDMLRTDFGQYSCSTIALFLCRIPIMLIA